MYVSDELKKKKRKEKILNHYLNYAHTSSMFCEYQDQFDQCKTY